MRRIARVNAVASTSFSLPYMAYSYNTMSRSLVKRIASDKPRMELTARSLLERFVPLFIETQFQRLPHDVDLSIETWLNGTHYTEKEKDKFRSIDEKINGLFKRKYLVLKCFMKEEFYPSIFKEARGIFSRSDEIKVLIGPIIKAIESHQYLNKNFIKHIPVADRPTYISEHLAGVGPIAETDYTAFESHFDPEMMELLDFSFYDYMTSNISDSTKSILYNFSDTNTCYFKEFVLQIRGTRMSGEMTTSSFNGFANFCLLEFVACYSNAFHKKEGTQLHSFDQIYFVLSREEILDNMVNCVIEGDDGLARYPYGVPDKNLYDECGLKLKLEVKESISTASFCGIVFDEDDKENLTDVTKHLIKTGWLSSKYVGAKLTKRKILLRAKAFSLAHQFPNCPVLRSYADYILRHTKHMHKGMIDYVLKHKFMDNYEREKFMKFGNKNVPDRKPIGMGSRMVIERLYKVPIEKQIEIEKYFDECNKLQGIPDLLIMDIIPEEWLRYSIFYVHEVQESVRDTEFTVCIPLSPEFELPKPFDRAKLFFGQFENSEH